MRDEREPFEGGSYDEPDGEDLGAELWSEEQKAALDRVADHLLPGVLVDMGGGPFGGDFIGDVGGDPFAGSQLND